MTTVNHARVSRGGVGVALAAHFLFLGGQPASADGLFLRGAAEIDGDGSYWVSGGLRGDATTQTRWSASVSRSQVQNDSSADAGTTAADASLTHAWGPLAFQLGGRWWKYSDVVTARVLRSEVTYGSGRGYFGAAGEFRRSEFEPFAIATSVELANGTVVPVSANAQCDLDDRGVGLHAGWLGQGWHVHGEFMSHDYDAAKCGFDSPQLELLRNARREIFVQFAGRATNDLSRSAAQRVAVENSLLDHRWGIAAGIDGARIGYRLRFDRSEEAFAGLTSHTLTFGVSIPRASGSAVDLYVGVADSDAVGSVALVGVSIDLAL